MLPERGRRASQSWSGQPAAEPRRCRSDDAGPPLLLAEVPGFRWQPLAVKALHYLNESFWKEPVHREAQIGQRPPAMRCDRSRLVVAGTTRADLRTINASKEMPFILVEELVAVRDPCPPTKNDWSEGGDIKAEFLDQFSARRCLGRLAILDTPARWIPIQPAVGIRIKQEQQAVLLIEQEHTRDLALDHEWMLHRVEVWASLATASMKPTAAEWNTHSARQKRCVSHR